MTSDESIKGEALDRVFDEYLRAGEPERREKANYTSLPRGIHPTPVYLERFFANLMLGARHELKNRYLHITFKNPESELVPSAREQVGEQVKEQAVQEIKKRPSPYVVKLLKILVGEMTVLEMMAKLKPDRRRNQSQGGAFVRRIAGMAVK